MSCLGEMFMCMKSGQLYCAAHEIKLFMLFFLQEPFSDVTGCCNTCYRAHMKTPYFLFHAVRCQSTAMGMSNGEHRANHNSSAWESSAQPRNWKHWALDSFAWLITKKWGLLKRQEVQYPLLPATHLLPALCTCCWFTKLHGGGVCLAACILQLAAYSGKHIPQHTVWGQICVQKCIFFSAQVFTLATIKVAVKCSWHLNNAISSLCHTQFGLETCNVFSRKRSNLLWDFCSFAFKVNCPYVWMGSVQDPSLFKTRLI